MTTLQNRIIARIDQHGVAVLATKQNPQAYRTARALMKHGYTYYGTGQHVAIGTTAVVCEMAVTWANNRHEVSRFNAKNPEVPLVVNPPHYKDFPGIEIPDFLRGDAWTDQSWKNDACAHSEMSLEIQSPSVVDQLDPVLTVWVEYEKPEDREMTNRFVVGYAPNRDRDSMDHTLYIGDDPELAKRAVDEFLVLYRAKCPVCHCCMSIRNPGTCQDCDYIKPKTDRDKQAVLYCTGQWVVVPLDHVLDDRRNNAAVETAQHHSSGLRAFKCQLCIDGIEHPNEADMQEEARKDKAAYQAEVFTVDPDQFGESEWEEMFNACELIPPNEDKTPAEQKHRAKAFTATREDIQQAIASCESKAERVRAGELGKTDEGEGVDIDDWANDLETAAAVLRELIGEIRPLDPGFMRPVDSQNTKHMELIRDLWWFIENVSETTPDRTDRFFALRERVRGMSQDLVSCPKCGKQIARKDAVTDQGTGEETGRTFTYCSEFCKETH